MLKRSGPNYLFLAAFFLAAFLGAAFFAAFFFPPFLVAILSCSFSSLLSVKGSSLSLHHKILRLLVSCGLVSTAHNILLYKLKCGRCQQLITLSEKINCQEISTKRLDRYAFLSTRKSSVKYEDSMPQVIDLLDLDHAPRKSAIDKVCAERRVELNVKPYRNSGVKIQPS